MEDKELLLARLAQADTEELIRILAQPSLEEHELLRAYLGPKCFQRLRGLVLHRRMVRREARGEPKGNVVVVPSLLANELSFEQDGRRERVWLSAKAVATGQLAHLRLDDKGRFDRNPNIQLQASGVMKRYYGELLLTLAQQWNTCAFWYDWRKSLELAATQLRARIDSCFDATAPVHIVAVGEGGMVARLYIAQHERHWREHGGRLLLLGTPHYGAPVFVQALAGHLDIAWWADLLDNDHSHTDITDIIRSFPSIYQLLPSPDLDPKMLDLYDVETYGNSPGIRKPYLDEARELQTLLASAGVPEHTICLAGYNQPTFDGIDLAAFKQALAKRTPAGDLQELASTLYTLGSGDGSVPLASAVLKTGNGEAVPTYYVDVAGTQLISSPIVLRSLDRLLAMDLDGDAWRNIEEDLGLAFEIPDHELHRQAGTPGAGSGATNQQKQKEWREVHSILQTVARNLSARAGEIEQGAGIAAHERIIEDSLLRHLNVSHMTSRPRPALQASFRPPCIAVDVKLGGITELDELSLEGPPVDAIVVGHYLGELPQGAFKHLDIAVSTALRCKEHRGDAPEPARSDLIFSQFVQRGVIRSELASFFFLADPRLKSQCVQRTIIVAGTGLPGRFGVPELRIMVRELCWMMCRLGMKHMATTLIGAGQSHLPVADVAEAWLHGLKDAVTGHETDGAHAVRVTFVELDARKILELDEAIKQHKVSFEKVPRMWIDYTPLTDEEVAAVKARAVAHIDEEAERRKQQFLQRVAQLRNEASKEAPASGLHTETDPDAQAVRIAVQLEGSTYRFGAITSTASIPEREIRLDTRLVTKANDELAASDDAEDRVQRGEFMARLLLPEDFRTNLSGGAPVILTLDSTTARIHWELLRPPQELDQGGAGVDELDRYLCIGCGLTRQLRTSFAPRLEPLPPPKRLLRVLVVADPAADARLPGAEEEGCAVADLFEAYNQITCSENRVEVVRLIGPGEATRTNVLSHLMTRSYDVLHYSGHCVYEKDNPMASGWIFTGGERLTAHEIRRIDRVPAFVFSNACESGVTPDRSGNRSDALAPTFAETFFARGVSNFVCTAWPVADLAARDFALVLYAELLGLKFTGAGLRIDRTSYESVAARPIYMAMRAARRASAGTGTDGRTWGAYQHYGSPYFRLFAGKPTKLTG